MDAIGAHARSCCVGGWLVRRHNAGVNAIADWAEQCCECTVVKEQVLPAANDEHTESRLDLVIHSPRAAGPIYVDFTVVSAVCMRSLEKGSALADGVAAAVAATEKTDKYPGCTVFPFPVEAHGRLGEAAVTLLRMLAPVGPGRSSAIAGLHQDLACTLQRASADAVLAAKPQQRAPGR